MHLNLTSEGYTSSKIINNSECYSPTLPKNVVEDFEKSINDFLQIPQKSEGIVKITFLT